MEKALNRTNTAQSKVGIRYRVATVLLLVLSLVMISDFVFRGIGLAFKPRPSDFSELYISATLWRQGENPYDPALAASTHERLVGVRAPFHPVYPLTTLALISPITFIHWQWANLMWLLAGLGSVVAMIDVLLRLRGWTGGLGSLAFAAFVLSFDPLHQSFHQGNVALFAIPLSFWGIFLAERKTDWAAGLMLGLCLCLKPQLGLWTVVYYLLKGRWRLLRAVLSTTAILVLTVIARPLPPKVISTYRANIHYWFAPQGQYGFMDGALPFHVCNVQVILYRLFHNIDATIVVAYLLFCAGGVLWFVGFWRSRFELPVPLAIASLYALSFISIYHSVSDATVLLLALCWAFKDDQRWTGIKIAVCVVLCLILLPGHSLLMHSAPHLSSSDLQTWWWNLIVARYFVWLLFCLNVALLVGVWQSANDIRREQRKEDQSAPASFNESLAHVQHQSASEEIRHERFSSRVLANTNER